MKQVHISFGNEIYYKSLDLLEKTSIEIGKVDKFIRYTQEWLKTQDFWNNNQFILNQPRGAGYWIWKPYIILKTFESLNYNDCVLYSDAGVKVTNNLDILFEIVTNNSNGGKMIFKVPGVNIAKHWTKKDCFILTNSDSLEYWNAPMSNGAISLWVKNDENINFLNEWQKYLRDFRIVTDSNNIFGINDFNFRDHRHDQSVLTILTKKYNFELYRDPTQWGNSEVDMFDNSPYPQLFFHHRRQGVG